MNIFKKSLIGAAIAVGLATSAHATPITIGGVTWDPDYSDLTDHDFIAQFNFTQWYSTTIASFGAISQANLLSAANIADVNAALGGSGATGYYLQGAGEVTYINGVSAPAFCTNCELTYAFGGIGLNKDSTFDLTSAWAGLWVSSLDPDFTFPVSNGGELADAQSGTLWLSLDILEMSFQSGTVGNGVVSAVLEAIDGAALGNFLPTTLTYTADANFVSNPRYSGGGNGSVAGNTIPEPGSLALAGLGFLGLGALRRRKTHHNK